MGLNKPASQPQPLTTCAEADEIDRRARFSGWTSKSEALKLGDHALHCGRSDWYHAYPTALWGSMTRNRERKDNLPRR